MGLGTLDMDWSFFVIGILLEVIENSFYPVTPRNFAMSWFEKVILLGGF